MCSNGVGATGPACPAEGAAACASCDTGYALAGGACAPLECVCPDGVGATGPACPAAGAALCVACDPGFALAAFGRSCR